MNSRHFWLIIYTLSTLILLISCEEKSTGLRQPVLSVSPSVLDFGTDQLGLRLFISNGGEQTLEWNIENPSGSWYECSPASGSTTAETDTVEIMVDRSGLTGEFTDTVTVTSNGGTASAEIMMQVSTSPTLSVYPANLDFGVEEDMLYFEIVNSGPGLLEWNLSENIDWLELSADTGSCSTEPDTITASIQRPNSSNDGLSGEIQVSSNGGSQSIGVSARDTVYADDGIFVFLSLERVIIRHHMGQSPEDMIKARFDGSNTPCEPTNPLAADSVYCGQYALEWNSENSEFEYAQNMPRHFLSLGTTYFFSIMGNSDVPSMMDSVTLPLYAPSLTTPIDSAAVSRNSDLSVEWTGVGENQVTLSIILSSDSICALPYNTSGTHGINIDTDNDGQYIFTSSQLTGLGPGEYRLILTNYIAHGISANGYDADSFIMAKSTSSVIIYLQ